MSEQNIRYMQECLNLAKLGFGSVAPNPLVGAIIVKDKKIIGRGYHQRHGQAHAEVNAINSVIDKDLLSGSCLYVNLEPCSHFGKTPPCADLLIRSKIKKVFIANLDPNPLVAGSGVSKLKAAGIDVEIGILEKEAYQLNRRFFSFHQKKRPFIILKWAQSEDGFIGRENEKTQISSPETSKLVHSWRAQEAAIMVGTNTVLCDNPKLNVRYVLGNNPIRVVIDRKLKIPTNFNIYDKTQKTLIYCEQPNEQFQSNIEFRSYTKNESDLNPILSDLYFQNIQSLFVEGGAKLLQSFIKQGYYDEVRIIQSKIKLFSGIKAPEGYDLKFNTNKVTVISTQHDQIFYYSNPAAKPL